MPSTKTKYNSMINQSTEVSFKTAPPHHGGVAHRPEGIRDLQIRTSAMDTESTLRRDRKARPLFSENIYTAAPGRRLDERTG